VPLNAPTRAEAMFAGSDKATTAGDAHERSDTKMFVVPDADR
jgi:hypothetical protein